MNNFGFGMPQFDPSILQRPEVRELSALNDHLQQVAASNSASSFVQHIARQIRDFEATLDTGSEIGAYLVNFGQALTIHVRAFVAIEPSLIAIEGVTGDGGPVRLVQHVSQISFLLVKAKKLDPGAPRKEIGFRIVDERK